MIKYFIAGAAVALCAAPSFAQQSGRPTTEKDVSPQQQPILPVPSSNKIIVPFGDTARIYFKRPFKSIRMGDADVVRARPESDHVIEFSGMAPGMSRFDLEASDGSATASGEVIVVREASEVKIYTPTVAQKPANVQNAAVVINQAPDGGVDAKKSADAEYSSRLCNEVGCRPVPQAR